MTIDALAIQARGLTFPALSSGQGPLVLCLHGFPDSPRSFRHLLPALAAQGYRAVAPTLRGYAPSCLAPGEHDVLEAARDVVALVEALGESRAHLVGHDWGAVASYLAARLEPARFRSVCTMAVPHPLGLLRALARVPRQLSRSWYMSFFQLPWAERAFRAGDFALLDALWRTWSPGFVDSDYERHLLKTAFDQPGVTPAALAYYRALRHPRSESMRTALTLLTGRIEAPVLALTGEADGCIDTRVYDRAMEARYFRDVTVERLRDAGHFLHLESPERVNARIIAWLAHHTS